MFFAITEEGIRVSAEEATKGAVYTCPCCEEQVILNKGDIRSPYFSHKAYSTCSVSDNDMCEWHKRMQGHFSNEHQEVVFKHNGMVHRADVFKDNYVIEFQHSSISLSDFNARNTFYKELGYKIIWVFDTSDWFRESRIVPLSSKDDNKFVVKRPLQLWQNISDDKDISICFCETDEDTGADYVFNVYWHTADWSRVMFPYYDCYVELSENTDLGELFLTQYERRGNLLKGKSFRKVYRGVKGYLRHEYNCKDTNDWARDCVHCKNCLLEEICSNGGTIYYCNNDGHIDVDYSISAPYIIV